MGTHPCRVSNDSEAFFGAGESATVNVSQDRRRPETIFRPADPEAFFTADQSSGGRDTKFAHVRGGEQDISSY